MDKLFEMKELIAEDNIKEALQKLTTLAKTDEYINELIIQKARYNRLRRKNRISTITAEISDIEINKIRLALLELINEIENSSLISSKCESDLSEIAKTILFEVSQDPNAQANIYSTKEGWEIHIGKKCLFSNGGPRERIAWQDAISQLQKDLLIQKLDTSYKYEKVYEITMKGFEIADRLSEKDSALIKEKFGSFTDPRDGQEYRTISLLGKLWLAENMNFDIEEDCWYYNNDPGNGKKYGRLYTWDGAFKACPRGWRLPSKEEFQELTANFGGGLSAYRALTDGGFSGFNMVLSGIRDPDSVFSGGGLLTSFWIAQEYETNKDKAYFYYFKAPECLLHMNLKNFGFSVRCIKDLD